MIETEQGIRVEGESYPGVGLGIFLADAQNRISAVAVPGDPGPGGTFDFFTTPSINDSGRIAFAAHMAGEEVGNPTPQEISLAALTSVFVRGTDGQIERVASAGELAPGGGSYRRAYAPIINRRGEVSFNAALDTDENADGRPTRVSTCARVVG